MKKMKDSELEWISELPSNWEICRIKELFYEVNERCSNGAEYELLSVSEYYGVAPKAERISEADMLTHAETLDGYKICKVGDIVMNIMLAWKRAMGVSKYDGIVSPAYCVYRPQGDVNSAFFHYLFRTDVYANLFKQFSTGIIDSRLRLYPDKFLALKCQVPPIETQYKIVDYLDIKCSKIDDLIEKQKTVIEKLTEYKLEVITEAVTKGLSPDMELKDSGTRFIGYIPYNWTVSKLKYMSLAIGDGIHGTPEYDSNGEIYFVNGNNIGAETLVFKADTNTINETEFKKYKKPLLNNNTILMTLNGATYGKTSFYSGEEILLGKSAGYITLKPNENKEFVRYYLQSAVAKLIMDYSLCGSTIANVSLRTLNDFAIPYPSKAEQVDIVRYLDKHTSQIDKSISCRQNIIERLLEYKKSLIYEVVTGKKEV